MRLIVSGLNAAKAPLRFDHLFGRYLYGFRPWTHCKDCFVARIEKQVNPNMQDGTYELRDNLFYLCGVGKKVSDRKDTNVHLAVMPRKGSVAAIGSIYGVSFLIEDAQAIPIEVPPQSLSWLEEKHYRCKMFQFAYQMFETGEINLTPGEPVRRLRERWRSISQIGQDESGCVIDPGTASATRHLQAESVPA